MDLLDPQHFDNDSEVDEHAPARAGTRRLDAASPRGTAAMNDRHPPETINVVLDTEGNVQYACSTHDDARARIDHAIGAKVAGASHWRLAPYVPQSLLIAERACGEKALAHWVNFANGDTARENEEHCHRAPPFGVNATKGLRVDAAPHVDREPISRLARRIRDEHRLMADADNSRDSGFVSALQAMQHGLWFKLAVFALVFCAGAFAWHASPWK
jgi:hypothetical protein